MDKITKQLNEHYKLWKSVREPRKQKDIIKREVKPNRIVHCNSCGIDIKRSEANIKEYKDRNYLFCKSCFDRRNFFKK